MMKNKVILICLICIFLVSTSVGALYYQTHESYDRLVHFFFKNMFKEPSEIMYILVWDDNQDIKIYKLTSNEEHRIAFNMDEVERRLGIDGLAFSDMILIIHSHQDSRYFSLSDVNAYWRFKRRGFTGKFYMYNELNKKLYVLRGHDKW